MTTKHNAKRALGEAGELLVLSRLLRLGYTAARLPENWAGDDILTSHGFTVQVKTTGQGSLKWMVGATEASPTRYCCLVDYREPTNPKVYVMSSGELARIVEAQHGAYLQVKPHYVDTGIRTISDPWPKILPETQYKNGWTSRFLENWVALPNG